MYKLVASEEQYEELLSKLHAGGYGWGHAKGDLHQALISKFGEAREKYHHYMNNKKELDDVLAMGAEKARVVAKETLLRVRSKMGY